MGFCDVCPVPENLRLLEESEGAGSGEYWEDNRTRNAAICMIKAFSEQGSCNSEPIEFGEGDVACNHPLTEQFNSVGDAMHVAGLDEVTLTVGPTNG